MSLIEALILGIVQGLAEFIPVSSSGHLLLGQKMFGVEEAGLSFDVALHLGTLFALIIFFYKDIAKLVSGAREHSNERRLVILLAIATLPAAVFGILIEDTADTTFRNAGLVAFNLALVGLLMLLVEHLVRNRDKFTKLKNITRNQAILMGLAQATALVPGVSRSGITITAGLFAGLDRVAATRFSFLLAIPITIGAVIKKLTEPELQSSIQTDSGIFAVGILASLVSGIFAIRFLLNFLSKYTLRAFAYYRIILALVVVIFLV